MILRKGDALPDGKQSLRQLRCLMPSPYYDKKLFKATPCHTDKEVAFSRADWCGKGVDKWLF